MQLNASLWSLTSLLGDLHAHPIMLHLTTKLASAGG
jgi:hypothetical protein